MIATAMLLLGSCGSASRTISVEPELERIILQCAIGGVKDVLARRSHESSWSIDRIYAAVEAADIRLRIDGHSRTGPFAWLAAANRVAGYALDRRRSGSVAYAYNVRVRDLDVWRSTRIEDGVVSLVTDVWGRIGPRGELHHVRLDICAVENWRAAMEGSTPRGTEASRQGGTRITASAIGWSTIGSRWWLLRWIADRRARRGKCQPLQEFIGGEIAKGLDADLLATIDRGGRRLYAEGDLHGIVEAFVERLRTR